jgi:hypothetical protein
MGSTVGITCWGCHKSETHPMLHGDEEKKQRQEWASRGWRRKAFWPSDHPTIGWDKGPWFCSEDCANNSYNARQAEEEWRQKEFEDYCRNTNVPVFFWLALGLAFYLISGFTLRWCVNA